MARQAGAVLVVIIVSVLTTVIVWTVWFSVGRHVLGL